jgi:hypothetical protein
MKRIIVAIGVLAISSLMAIEGFAQTGPIPGVTMAAPMDRPLDHPPFSPEAALALSLAAEETAIGIRADQIDVWRDYTTALLALLERPPGDGSPPGPVGAGPKPPEAFGHAARLADHFMKGAAKAVALDRAIQKLRMTLTPEQFARAAKAEQLLAPPLHRHEPPPADFMLPPRLNPEPPSQAQLCPPDQPPPMPGFPFDDQ